MVKGDFFLAIPLSEFARQQISHSLTALRKSQCVKSTEKIWRWVPAHRWHITVHFFGPLSPEALEDARRILTASVASLGESPFNLHLQGFGVFFHRKRIPRVLFVAVDRHSEPLKRVFEGLQAVHGMTFSKFHPHITIARANLRKVTKPMMPLMQAFGSAVQLSTRRLGPEISLLEEHQGEEEEEAVLPSEACSRGELADGEDDEAHAAGAGATVDAQDKAADVPVMETNTTEAIAVEVPSLRAVTLVTHVALMFNSGAQYDEIAAGLLSAAADRAADALERHQSAAAVEKRVGGVGGHDAAGSGAGHGHSLMAVNGELQGSAPMVAIPVSVKDSAGRQKVVVERTAHRLHKPHGAEEAHVKDELLHKEANKKKKKEKNERLKEKKAKKAQPAHAASGLGTVASDEQRESGTEGQPDGTVPEQHLEGASLS